MNRPYLIVILLCVASLAAGVDSLEIQRSLGHEVTV